MLGCSGWTISTHTTAENMNNLSFAHKHWHVSLQVLASSERRARVGRASDSFLC